MVVFSIPILANEVNDQSLFPKVICIHFPNSSKSVLLDQSQGISRAGSLWRLQWDHPCLCLFPGVWPPPLVTAHWHLASIVTLPPLPCVLPLSSYKDSLGSAHPHTGCHCCPCHLKRFSIITAVKHLSHEGHSHRLRGPRCGHPVSHSASTFITWLVFTNVHTG